MTLTVRSASVTGATTAARALTHAEMDANWAAVASLQSHDRQILYVSDYLSDANRTLWAAGTEVDITTALQAAIDSLGDTSVPSRAGCDILISGPSILSATVTIQRKGVRIVGNGWGNRSDTTGTRRSYLRWNGVAGIPMLKFIDCWSDAGVYRLKIMGLSTAKPSAAIELSNTGTGVAMQQIAIERVYFGGFASETDAGLQFTNGVLWSGTNNNSEHRLLHCYFNGCSAYSLKQCSIQNLNIKADHVVFQDCGTGMYICGAMQGSNWVFLHCTTADIETPFLDADGLNTDPLIVCQGYYSENAVRMASFSGVARFVIYGGQFQITSNLNADGKIATQAGNFALLFELNSFKFNQTSAPVGSPQLSFRSSVAGATERAIILNNITGWASLTGGTSGLDIATRGATDRTYVFFREFVEAASASPARVAQCWVTGNGGDWAASRYEVAGVQAVAPTGSAAAPSYAFLGDVNTGFYRDTSAGRITASGAGSNVLSFGAGYLSLPSTSVLVWCSSVNSLGTADLFLQRFAANILAQKNGNADQANQLYGMNGAYWQSGASSELITLSTVGATTDSVGNMLPANSIIRAVVARVTTTITTATDWKLGDATIAGRFTAANATLVAGTTDVGMVHIDLTGTSGPRQTAAAKLRITTTGTPGAGVVRVVVFYEQLAPPTS